ncbi:23S rRNA (adenine(2503)-C(2))-methyltransferase [Sarracenia purpurea var. burkii]
METSCGLWMRRLRPNHLLLVKAKPPHSLLPLNSFPAIPPLYFPPLKPPPPQPPLRSVSPISSNRRSLSNAAHPSPPISSTVDHDENGILKNQVSKKVLLKGMRYAELENWVRSHGFRPAQALMLWKRLYGNDIWAHCIDELEG